MKKNKTLIVEDTQIELDHAKEVAKNYQTIEPVYASNLANALSLYDQDTKFVVTDMFYPLGENIKNRSGICKILGDGLSKLVELTLKEGHRCEKEIYEYLGRLQESHVEDNEIPSGLLLGLHALYNGSLPLFITSEDHHGPILEPVFSLFRSYPIFEEGSLKEGLNEETGRKYWEGRGYNLGIFDLLPITENKTKAYEGASVRSFWRIYGKDKVMDSDLNQVRENMISNSKEELEKSISDASPEVKTLLTLPKRFGDYL